MVTFINTFYKRDDFIPFLEQAEDAIRRNLDGDSYEVRAIDFALSKFLYAESTYITRSDAAFIINRIARLAAILDDFHYEYDPKALFDLLSKGVTVETDVEEATEKHHELMQLLSRYHNLVEASHTVAQHGKLWEPAISITNLGDNTYKVSFCSYQAGDQEEDPIEGSLESVIDDVRDRVNTVQSRLLTGLTNTNPFVMMALDDNTASTTDVFEKLEKEKPYVYEDVFFAHGVFLPDATIKTVSFSGYVYNDRHHCRATVVTGEAYYPNVKDAIGVDSIAQ